MRVPSLAFALLVSASLAPSLAAITCDVNQAIIDDAKIPFGSQVECVGEFAERNSMELSPGQGDLKLARINGRGNQDHILVHLSGIPNPDALKPGQWLRVHGTLSDGKASLAWTELSMAVDKAEPIPAAPLTPADFVGRVADFEGTATGTGVKLDSSVLEARHWPMEVVGKHVGVHGIISKTGDGYAIDARIWHLIDPADMLGRTVTLEGNVFDLNGVWRFQYRDYPMVITDEHDHPAKLDYNRHASRARVTGLLVNQLRPSLEQISLKTDRDLVPTFVIRRAKVEFTEPLVDESERFREVFPTNRPVIDGVPVLLPQDIVRRNIMGDETRSHGYVDFNYPVIESILADPAPATLNVLAHRMEDPAIGTPMQLVYATMLATANDPRGRDRLSAAVEKNDDDFHSALYCLGAFNWLMPEKSKIKTDAAWAEPLMIRLLSEKRKDGTYATAGDVVRYSSIPDALIKLNTPESSKALIEFALAGVDETSSFFHSNVLHLIAESDMTVSHELLVKLESALKETGDRRAVLHIAVKENDAVAAALFFKELGAENWFESELRDHLTPEMVAQLTAHQNEGDDKTRLVIRELLLTTQKDPVPELLKLLDDPKFTDKNWIMWRLTVARDARCIAPLLHVLQTAPADYFSAEFLPGLGTRHAIEAIAAPQTADANSALIDLLDTDLARFPGYDRAGYQRLIAAQLIDSTGESFGTDAAAWRKWFSSQTPR